MQRRVEPWVRRVAERGAQAPAVEGAAGDEVGVRDRLGVERGALRLGERRHGVRGANALGVVACSRLQAEQAQEVLPALDGEAQAVESVGVADWRSGWRSTSASSGMVRVELRRVELGVGRDRPGVEARHRRHPGAPARDDRGAAVLALELADLPLARQQPQRVVDARGVSDVDARSPRAGSIRDQVVIDGIGFLRSQRVEVGRDGVAVALKAR